MTGDANRLAQLTIGEELDELTTDEQVECTKDFVGTLNKHGLTALDDPGGNNPFHPTNDVVLWGDHGYQAINRLHREGGLNARVRFSLSCFGSIIGLPCVEGHTVNAVSMIGDDTLRIGVGEEVLTLTGGIYADPEYAEFLEHLACNEWSFQHHATGATRRGAGRVVAPRERDLLDRGPQVGAAAPGGAPTHPSDATLATLRELNAGVVPTNTNADQPSTDQHPPYRRIYESGTNACLGTDALNVTPFPPFLNLWYTVSGETTTSGPGVAPEQRLTRLRALRMATEKCAGSWIWRARSGRSSPAITPT